jgi:hypothetical protein
VAIAISAFVAVWAASSVIDAVDRLPLFGDLFELIGVVFSGWFIYRYLIFKPDRWVGADGKGPTSMGTPLPG